MLQIKGIFLIPLLTYLTSCLPNRAKYFIKIACFKLHKCNIRHHHGDENDDHRTDDFYANHL